MNQYTTLNTLQGLGSAGGGAGYAPSMSFGSGTYMGAGAPGLAASPLAVGNFAMPSIGGAIDLPAAMPVI